MIAYVGASFSKDIESMEVFLNDYHNAVMLFYTKEEVKLVYRTNFRGRTQEQKFMQMAYF